MAARVEEFVDYPKSRERHLPPRTATKAEVQKRLRSKVNDVKKRDTFRRFDPFSGKDKPFKFPWEVLFRVDKKEGRISSMDRDKEPDFLMDQDELMEFGRRFIGGYVDLTKGKIKEPDYRQRELEKKSLIKHEVTEYKHKNPRSELVFEQEIVKIKSTGKKVSVEWRVERVPQRILMN